MGFEQLPGYVQEGVAQEPFTESEVRSADGQWDDDVAMGVVLQDTERSLEYLQSKGLVPFGIEKADDLIRAYIRPRQWPDGKPRANLSMHVTLQAIEKILPALYLSLFGQGKKRPFLIDPVGKTKPEAARAQAALLSWAMKQAKTKEEMRITLKNALSYGFTVGTWGWESKQQRKKVYVKNPETGMMSGKLEVTDIEIPSYECLDLRKVLVDPTLTRQDVHSGAKFIIKQYFTNGYGLADFRDNASYKNIPSEEELADFLSRKSEPVVDSLNASKRPVWREFQAKLEQEQEYKDPMLQPLEILEWTSKDRVVSVLQRKLVIRNDENEFGKLNFQSCAFIDVLNSAWGFGVAKLLAGEQRLQQGVANNGIDSLALVLNPVFQLLKGIGPGTQAIPLSPGKVITESGELKPLIVPDVTKPTFEWIVASDQRAMEKVGANGGSNMPNQAMRTAQGVNAFASDVIQRLQYFLEIFIDLVYIPVLEAFLMIMKDHLTPKQINSILTEEDGKAYDGDISEVYNAEVNVDVLAGSNMMAKFAAAQLLPMLIQLTSAGPIASQLEVQGQYIDYGEWVKEGIDMMGWDIGSIFKPMTPEMKQNVQMKNQAAVKAQSDAMQQQQQQQNDLAQIDAKASGQAGVAVVRTLLKNNEMGAVNAIEQQQQPEGPQ